MMSQGPAFSVNSKFSLTGVSDFAAFEPNGKRCASHFAGAVREDKKTCQSGEKPSPECKRAIHV